MHNIIWNRVVMVSKLRNKMEQIIRTHKAIIICIQNMKSEPFLFHQRLVHKVINQFYVLNITHISLFRKLKHFHYSFCHYWCVSQFEIVFNLLISCFLEFYSHFEFTRLWFLKKTFVFSSISNQIYLLLHFLINNSTHQLLRSLALLSFATKNLFKENFA